MLLAAALSPWELAQNETDVCVSRDRWSVPTDKRLTSYSVLL